MTCDVEKCATCAKKNQCQKYPVMLVLSSNQSIESKMTVLSNIALNIIDKLDILQESIDALSAEITPPPEKQTFIDKILSREK